MDTPVERWRTHWQDTSTQEHTAADGQDVDSNATTEPPQIATQNRREEVDGVRGVSFIQDVVDRADNDNDPAAWNDHEATYPVGDDVEMDKTADIFGCKTWPAVPAIACRHQDHRM